MRAAADVADGQRHFKPVVAELGGKNCVIVTADADLDDAVPAIVGSAFAYAGQKCSAASRVLVHEAIADQLAERIAGAVALLAVGQADDLQTDVPPVIESDARDRVARYAALAARRRRDRRQAPTPPAAAAGGGWFCPATVARDLDPASAVLHEEIFGPMLALDRVRDVEHACDLVDELPFALTGGLFTRDPATVRRVRERTPVGNLYVNRGITGAMVARQPFGGNRLSGTGLKAGGPDYLPAVRRAARGQREHHAPRPRGLTPALKSAPSGSIMTAVAVPLTDVIKLGFAFALALAIAFSAFSRAPRESVPIAELRRLVACALLLYAVGAVASLAHRTILAGLLYAAGISVASLAAWLSRGRDQEDPPPGDGHGDGDDQPPPDPDGSPAFDWGAFEREFRDYAGRGRTPARQL